MWAFVSMTPRLFMMIPEPVIERTTELFVLMHKIFTSAALVSAFILSKLATALFVGAGCSISGVSAAGGATGLMVMGELIEGVGGAIAFGGEEGVVVASTAFFGISKCVNRSKTSSSTAGSSLIVKSFVLGIVAIERLATTIKNFVIRDVNTFCIIQVLTLINKAEHLLYV